MRHRSKFGLAALVGAVIFVGGCRETPTGRESLLSNLNRVRLHRVRKEDNRERRSSHSTHRADGFRDRQLVRLSEALFIGQPDGRTNTGRFAEIDQEPGEGEHMLAS